MSDAKYFQRGKIQDLRAELATDRKDIKHTKKKTAMKKIVANMTMGNDMSPLFPDVVACMNVPVLEVKKMVYLYLINYARSKPELAVMAVNTLAKDAEDFNPLIRALAIRTMGYIQVDRILDELQRPLHRALDDKDPYVAKTAAICVAKLFVHNREMVKAEGYLTQLKGLLSHENSTVVANAVAALMEISDRSDDFDFVLDVSQGNKLLTALNESSEWGQAYLLDAIMRVVPQEAEDAELLADRISPRLQHANSAVVMTAVRVILYLTNYTPNEEVVNSLLRKLGPPLVTLLHSGPEVQYVALRNILLLLQRKPDILKNELKVFFCKYNDPIYVKMAKLEIMVRLATEANVEEVLPELKEYSSEVDVDFVRKAVRSIGRCAIKIEPAADRCIKVLVDLIQTKVNYVVQEAIVVIKDIFRKYPNRYESIIGTLCENLDSLDEPDAKASMIWIIGQYADRIENANELLDQFLEKFLEETAEVQLALLTAIVKLFIKRPSVGQELVPKVLKYATEESDNPDLRDRGFIYWRLLSTDPVAAKAIILSDKPAISTETDNIDNALLQELLLHVSTLASIYHKPATTFIGGVKPRKLMPSKALVFRNQIRTGLPHDVPEDSNPYATGAMNNPYMDDVALSPMHAGPAGQANMQDLLDLDMGGGYEDTGADVGGAFGDGLMGQAGSAAGGGNGGDDSLASLAFGGIIGQQEQLQLQQQQLQQQLQQTQQLYAGSQLTNQDLFGGGYGAGGGYGGQAQGFQQPPGAMAGGITGVSMTTNPFGAPAPPQMHQPPMSGYGGAPLGMGGLPLASATATPPPLQAQSSTPSLPQQTANPLAMLDPFAKTSSSAPTPGGGGADGAAPQPPLAINPATAAATPPAPAQMQQQQPAAAAARGIPHAGYGGGGMGALAGDLASLDIGASSGPRPVLLTAQNGKGLEISGAFSRRHGAMFLDLTLANKALQPLTVLGILFNKNSFSLVPGALDLRQPVFPNSKVETSVQLRVEGLPQPSTPINNLQIAIKTSVSILYLQTLIPLHILLLPADAQPLPGQPAPHPEPQLWVRTWGDMGDARQTTRVVAAAADGNTSADHVRNLLQGLGLVTVAQRVVDGTNVLYTSSRLPDGSLFLSEIKLVGSNVAVATRTYASHLVALFLDSVEAALGAAGAAAR
ncbi:AP-1 complex subunit beta-1 [Geranomyces variabilis]|nr:AP-1 complex subunit beta-1 [Geranomyces variabilis]